MVIIVLGYNKKVGVLYVLSNMAVIVPTEWSLQEDIIETGKDLVIALEYLLNCDVKKEQGFVYRLAYKNPL